MVDGTFRVGEQRVGIRATSEELGEWIDHALGRYRMKRWVYPEYSLVTGGDGDRNERGGRRYNILYWGLTPLVRTFDLETLGRAFLAELESRVLAERRDGLYVRGSLMTADGVTGLVPSWVVSHVASMGRRAERLGVTLPGETWVAVDPTSGKVLPKPAVLDLPDDTLERLRETAAAMDGSGDSRVDRLFVEQPHQVDVVFTYTEDGEPFAPVSKAHALHRLGASAANIRGMGGTALVGLQRMLAGAHTSTLGLVPAREM
ncbi:MAG: hypothetical protein ACRDPR_19475, partial [Nocardioidaceae bacterium]